MRYIGNKAKLVETIDDFLKNNNIEVEGKIFCDLFSGTATVADYFQDRCHIIVNDSLYFSYAISAGKVKHNDNFFKELGFCPFDFFNSQNTDQYKHKTPINIKKVFVITRLLPQSLAGNIFLMKMLKKLILLEILLINGLRIK